MNAISQGVCALIGHNQAAPTTWALALFASSVGLLVMVGLLTPCACVIASLGYLVKGVVLFLQAAAGQHANAFAAFDLAAISITLVLLGPGAFSADARLFGPREIIIRRIRVHIRSN